MRRAVLVVAVLAGIALVAAWMAGTTVRRTVRAVLAVLTVLALYVGATFAQVWWASTRTDDAKSSAIIVLGAAQWNGRPSPVLKARLDRAAELYRSGLAPTVIVTGAKQKGDRVGEAFTGYDYLRGVGLPESALKLESTGTDTYEELSASAHILDQAGLDRSVMLVSSPYHALRAVAIAEEVGLRAHFAPADDGATWPSLVRETTAVSIGRLISYRRLSNLQ